MLGLCALDNSSNALELLNPFILTEQTLIKYSFFDASAQMFLCLSACSHPSLFMSFLKKPQPTPLAYEMKENLQSKNGFSGYYQTYTFTENKTNDAPPPATYHCQVSVVLCMAE